MYSSVRLSLGIEKICSVSPEEGLLLEPDRLYLGRTNEYTYTEGFVPMLEGRSSVGRLGLFIHVTAGFGDVGFARKDSVSIDIIIRAIRRLMRKSP